MAKCRLRDARRRSADEGDRGHAALADRLAQSCSISRGARCTYSCTPRREFATLEETLPGMLDETLQDSVRRFDLAKKSGQVIKPTTVAHSDYIPLRITTQTQPGQEFGKVKGEMVAGRGLWFLSMRHLLTKTAKVLHNHRWSILTPPADLPGFTPMVPVSRWNNSGNAGLTFKAAGVIQVT